MSKAKKVEAVKYQIEGPKKKGFVKAWLEIYNSEVTLRVLGPKNSDDDYAPYVLNLTAGGALRRLEAIGGRAGLKIDKDGRVVLER